MKSALLRRRTAYLEAVSRTKETPLQDIPPETREQIAAAIRRPRGSVVFDYASDDLFDRGIRGGILLQVVAGTHVFRLERDEEFCLNFYHASPGTGTRVATIPLAEITPAHTVFLAFTWDPSQITLSIGPRLEGGTLHRAEGNPSTMQLRVGADGSVIALGDKGLSVAGTRVYISGIPVLLPTALEVWDEVVRSANVLLEAIGGGGYLRELAISNSVLTMLVTGFESYGKGRFIELEGEGIAPNTGALFGAIFSKAQIDHELPQLLQTEALHLGVSVLNQIVQARRINFQDYDQSKKSFKAAYGIRFGDLDLTSQHLNRLQRIIRYRHSIIHVSPLLGLLNQDAVPPEEPEFSNAGLATDSIGVFQGFIQALHKATLELDRAD